MLSNPPRPRATFDPDDPLFRVVADVVSAVPVDFGGGCPMKKAYAMAWLIRAENVRASLDIGIYRGRSLVPQAVAHRDFTGGIAYGVDPFSSQEAIQNDSPALRDRLQDFIARTDFEAIHTDVLRLIERLGLGANCRVVRKTSEEAAAVFARDGVRFGLVHIDGNHDTAMVLRDVELYLPLLAPGGLVVMDDVSWASVRPAFDVVAAQAALLFYESKPTVTELDYAVFQVGRPFWKTRSLRKALEGMHG